MEQQPLEFGRIGRPLPANGVPYRGINVVLLWTTAMEFPPMATAIATTTRLPGEPNSSPSVFHLILTESAI
jgi:hypothetical protein